MPASRRPLAPGASGRGSSRPSGGQSGPSAQGKPRQRPAKPAASSAARPASAGSTKSDSAHGGWAGELRRMPFLGRRGRRASTGASTAGRSRIGMTLPEVVTVRTLVLSVVVLLAVVLLLPTLRAYVNQTGELRELRGQLAEAEANRRDLEVQLARWDDNSYVIQQARDRLNFIMPGDAPWRVIDPETVVDDTNPATGETLTDGPIHDFAPKTSWYESIWGSVQLAGERSGHGSGKNPSEAPGPSSSPAPSSGAAGGVFAPTRDNG